MNNGNIILNQIITDGSSYKFREFIPPYTYSNSPQTLLRYEDNFLWTPIDLSFNVIVNNKFRDTNIYYDKGRIGVGRFPLFNYKIDVAVPKNKLMTAFHIGDGTFGFSMGNGTTEGFIPEIIGIGSDENNAGLYFVSIAGNDVSSNVPLILLDGRNAYNRKSINRPIIGITSANYNEYAVLVDASNNLNINGNIIANDMLINNISLLDIIKDLQKQINDLKT